uniref:NADH-ubiquinone oxidoreductase chain 6 n=1 Tax=Typhlatya miravetensis TaxID=390490 RepID=A0A2H1DQS2_9EUCA|nr:NADH dehydrogenase subunit 6 [Typhlatya miravetensis]SCN12529.1 NADH dehydrogenase subunit 6 [Typhlatya miravetensis]
MASLTLMMILTSSLSIMFTKITHPLAMGVILLIQTSLIAMMMTFTLKTTWFSYILFLIFLGAMLVLFIYVASLAPNEPLSLSFFMITLMITGIIFSTLTMTLDPFLVSHPIPNGSSILNFPNNLNFTNLSLNTMYNTNSMKMTLFLILYLLLTLVVVVKITATHFGPLRMN